MDDFLEYILKNFSSVSFSMRIVPLILFGGGLGVFRYWGEGEIGFIQLGRKRVCLCMTLPQRIQMQQKRNI